MKTMKPGMAVFALVLVLGLKSQASEFSQQWGLKNSGQTICDMSGEFCQSGIPGKDIQAEAAWLIHKDCRSTLVAVLDSGADFSHPDLKNNLVVGQNFIPTKPTLDVNDDNLHGTHVAGTIAAGGSETNGAMGICNQAKVLVVKVADAMGRLSDSDIIEGINFAASKNAKVLNASFGGGGRSIAMSKAIKKASKTLFVVAAGNGNMLGIGFSLDRTPVYPASYKLPNMVVVAATNNRDELGQFSNFGPKTVDLSAPGVGILSTTPVSETAEMKEYAISSKYAVLDGTSMATPHVTGAVALLMSYRPSLTLAQAKQKLLSSVDLVSELAGKVRSGGRLNLVQLLK